MKKLVLLSAIAMSGLFYSNANAQFSVHLGVNLFPHRVLVAPAVDVNAPVYADANYDNNEDYYYLPDVNAYYNINEQCYYYFDGDNWISAAYLPGEYHDYDWRNARRFEVRAQRPYLHNDFYMNRYRGNGNIAFNRDHFRDGFDGGYNRYANRGQQRFDNDGYRQQFDNRGGDQDRGNHNMIDRNNGWNNNRGQQPVQNQDHNQGWGNNRGQQNNQPSPQNNGSQNHGNARGNNGGQIQNQGQNRDNGNRGGQEQRIAQNNGGGHGGQNTFRNHF